MAGRSEAYLHVPFFYSRLFELGYEAVDDIDSRMQIVEDWLERFHKYVVWCLTGNRVRGVLLWNTCGQVSAASGIMYQGRQSQRRDLIGQLRESG